MHEVLGGRTVRMAFLHDAWDNLMFGFRLGDDTRGICTTTPKPVKWLLDLIANPATVTTRHSSYENRANLAPAFFQDIVRNTRERASADRS